MQAHFCLLGILCGHVKRSSAKQASQAAAVGTVMQSRVRGKHFLACDWSLGEKKKRGAVCQTPICRQSVALMVVGGTGTGHFFGGS